MSWQADDIIIIDECDNCNTENIEVKLYKGNDKGIEYHLCEVCSSTFLSHALFYPAQCSNAALFRSVAYCTNMILKKLEKTNVKPSS